MASPEQKMEPVMQRNSRPLRYPPPVMLDSTMRSQEDIGRSLATHAREVRFMNHSSSHVQAHGLSSQCVPFYSWVLPLLLYISQSNTAVGSQDQLLMRLITLNPLSSVREHLRILIKTPIILTKDHLPLSLAN